MEFSIKFHSAEEAYMYEPARSIIKKSYKGKRVSVWHPNNPRWSDDSVLTNIDILIDPVIGNPNSLLLEARQSDEFSDLKLEVIDPESGSIKTYNLHKIILSTNSLFFKKLLSKKWYKESPITIKYDHTLFDFFLDYIYGKQIYLRGIEGIYILIALVYFDVVNLNVDLLVSNFDFIEKDDMEYFLEAVDKLYPEGMPGIVLSHIGTLLEFHEEMAPAYFKKFWHFLPKKVQNLYKGLLEDTLSSW